MAEVDLEKYGLDEKQLEKILIAKSTNKIKPLQLYLNGGKKYKFAAIADTHLCSAEEKLNELQTFYQLCREEGVADVYHAGDLLTGQAVYRGQEYEVDVFGADNQVSYVVDNYPRVKGITTHFIGGN